MDKRIQDVLIYIESSLHRNLPLGLLARQVNLSPWHLCHLFKAELGISPSQYVKRLRMKRAKELMSTTFLNIKEIMLRVGVNDESHFLRDFKRAFGATPNQYRRSIISPNRMAPPQNISAAGINGEWFLSPES
jgi:two-component system response regulator YesN